MGKSLPAKQMWVPSLGQEDPLEKEMATHSRIPWTEESGGLQQPMGSQRVGISHYVLCIEIKQVR